MIRNFTVSDKAAFLDMCMDFYSGEGVDHTIPAAYAEKTFGILVQDNSPFCDAYVCEQNGKIAGYVLLAITYSNEAGGEVVWIEELYTVPEARGTGVASELIDYVLDKYSTAARFRLEVTDENEGAVRLYRKKGFVPLKYNQMEILKNKQSMP